MFIIKNIHDHKFTLILFLCAFVFQSFCMEPHICSYDQAKDFSAVAELFKQEKELLYPHLIEDRDIEPTVLALFTAENTYVCKNANNELVGFINFMYQEPTVSCCGLWSKDALCSINYVAIHNQYRGNRHGKRLLLQVMQHALFNARLKRIDASIKENNTAAAKLFKNSGFIAANTTHQPHTLYTLYLSPLAK